MLQPQMRCRFSPLAILYPGRQQLMSTEVEGAHNSCNSSAIAVAALAPQQPNTLGTTTTNKEGLRKSKSATQESHCNVLQQTGAAAVSQLQKLALQSAKPYFFYQAPPCHFHVELSSGQPCRNCEGDNH